MANAILSINVEKLDKAKLKAWLNAGDGHGIYPASYFLNMGFDPKLVAQYTERQGTNPVSHKQTVFNGYGQPIQPVGVYGLDLLERLASQYDIRSKKLGRGFRAQELGEQLIKVLGL